MSAENKVPAIRFKGFSGEWVDRELGEITSKIGSGKTPKGGSTTYIAEGIPLLRSQNIYNNLVNLNDVAYITPQTHENMKNSSVLKNDVLLNITGASIGRSAVYLFSNEANVNQHVCIIRLIEGYSSKFLQLHLLSSNGQQQIDNNQAGGAREGLNFEHVGRMSFVFAPRNEQTKIGNYFQQLDTLIAQHQQKHNKLLSLKKALLEKMFPKQGEKVPEIRFKGFSGEWEEKMLGEVADIVGGGTPSTQISEYWNGSIHWYSPTEIGKKVYADESEKRITQKGLENSSAKILPANRTVLFTSRAGIGDMAILSKDGCTNQGFQSFILNDDYDTYFLYSSGHLIKEYALKHASGSTFLEISGKQLVKMAIKMPDFIEQTKIGNFFKNLDTLINQHQAQLKKLNNIKQACLEKMFV